MTSIYRQAEFLNQDEELLHKAMLLMGDEKAKLIDIVRDHQTFYRHLFKPVIDYLESYIEQSLKQPSVTATNHAIKTRDVMEPLQLPDRLWWAMISLMEVPALKTIIMPHLLPFSCFELRANYYENYPTGHLPKW